MTIGVTPFFSKSRMALINNIKKESVIFPDKKKYKIEYSDDFKDIVLKLLDKDKTQRLGSTDDIDEIMSHPYFATLSVEDLKAKKMTPPFIPDISSKDMTGQYIRLKTDQKTVADTQLGNSKIQKIKKSKNAFKEF